MNGRKPGARFNSLWVDIPPSPKRSRSNPPGRRGHEHKRCASNGTGANTNLEYEIEIAAPVQAVWKGLTDAGELSRWFPLEEDVKPGVGGTMRLSWGPECAGTAPISAWEPNRHFQWKEAAAPAPGEKDSGGGRAIVID